MKILLTFLLFSSLRISAQHQERSLFVYNVAFGGLGGGIGAILNKPKAMNWKKAFLTGAWQGSVGGALNYTGKRSIYLINKHKKYIYAWAGKLLHAAGYSIIQNAALCEPFLQNWNIDYGPVRFDFSFNKRKRFKARFLPESIFAMVMSGRTASFNLKQTLATGEITFTSKKLLELPNGKTEIGVSYGRAIAYVDNPDFSNVHKLVAHELIHQYQYSEYQLFNTWLQPLAKKIASKKLQHIFTDYIYMDIPYFLVPYNVAGHYGPLRYFKNFYEFEAERFATNAVVY